MTPHYILSKSLCREPHCADAAGWEKTAQSEIENLMWADHYSETGMQDHKKSILLANWNYFPTVIQGILERYGYAVEWSDQWTTCDDCQGLVKLHPDCYGWEPSFKVSENGNELLCHGCVAYSVSEQLMEESEDLG